VLVAVDAAAAAAVTLPSPTALSVLSMNTTPNTLATHSVLLMATESVIHKPQSTVRNPQPVHFTNYLAALAGHLASKRRYFFNTLQTAET